MGDTQDKVWAKTDAGMYASYFLHAQRVAEAWCKTCHGIDHMSLLCPLTPPSRGRTTPQQQGASYNNTGGKGKAPAEGSIRRRDADERLIASDAMLVLHVKDLIHCISAAAKATNPLSRNLRT